MRFVPSILLAAAYAATSVTAAAAVEVEPGLFMQSFADGEIEVDPNVTIGDAIEDGSSTGLTKRGHEQCWGNQLTTTQNQEAYEDDCENLIAAMAASTRVELIQPQTTIIYRTTSFRCKIIVRNESTCTIQAVGLRTSAAAARDTLNQCPSLDECSGWGYINNINTLAYILEPFSVAPPAYSPRC
ncbi:hypothetical protein NQ176_g5021 [Zarea fungicola]|uniref:Uncharacterized protein n=1 Tax=Zarea fungicola TaxID=93591 RepID=A0ACC1NBN5_9HYPO|nr:hypothetical protein NQ176_g5021 [Lecanicillium fungicola]